MVDRSSIFFILGSVLIGRSNMTVSNRSNSQGINRLHFEPTHSIVTIVSPIFVVAMVTIGWQLPQSSLSCIGWQKRKIGPIVKSSFFHHLRIPLTLARMAWLEKIMIHFSILFRIKNRNFENKNLIFTSKTILLKVTGILKISHNLWKLCDLTISQFVNNFMVSTGWYCYWYGGGEKYSKQKHYHHHHRDHNSWIE